MAWADLATIAGYFLLYWLLTCAGAALCLALSHRLALFMLQKFPRILVIARRRGPLSAFVQGLIIIPLIAFAVGFELHPLSQLMTVDGLGGQALDAIAALILAGIAGDSISFSFTFRLRYWRPIWKYDIPPNWRSFNFKGVTRAGLDMYWFQLATGLVRPLLLLLPIAVAWWIARYQDELSQTQFLALLVLSVLPMLTEGLIKKLIRRTFPVGVALAFLSTIANQMYGRTLRYDPQNADPDPLDWYRWRFARAAAALERVAAKLERRLAGGGHPVAVILQKAADHMRAYYRGSESISGRLSDDAKALVEGSLAVVLGSARPGYYRRLAELAGALNGAGELAPRPQHKRRDLVAYLARLGEGGESLRKVIIPLMIIVAIVLFAAGKLDIKDVPGLGG